MSFKTVFSMLAVAVVGSLSVAACAAPTDAPADPEEAAAESQDAELRMASYNACHSDDDCETVSKGGCCPNGWNVAVNKTKATAYANATKCTIHNQMCPLGMVLDTRVAQCNAKKKCEMVKPEDIACGGFIMGAHHCPTGYSCDHTGVNPDAAGKCVKDAPPPPPDCTTTGCPSGKKCSACWGHMACIPKGAMC
jgi:hypothetical protein